MRVTQHIKNNIPKFSLYYIGITCINYPLTFTVHIQILLECVYVVFFFLSRACKIDRKSVV